MRSASQVSPTIVTHLMPVTMLNSMTASITAIVRNNRAQSLTKLADLITSTLDEQFTGHWHTVVVGGHPDSLERSRTNDSNSVIRLGQKGRDLVALDDHKKVATFNVVYDFGDVLRIHVFK